MTERSQSPNSHKIGQQQQQQNVLHSWLLHAAAPSLSSTALTTTTFGKPPRTFSHRRGAVAKYRNRVRSGLCSSLSGSVIRDVRIALAAASTREYDRKCGTMAAFDGVYKQHDIWERNMYANDENGNRIEDAVRQLDAVSDVNIENENDVAHDIAKRIDAFKQRIVRTCGKLNDDHGDGNGEEDDGISVGAKRMGLYRTFALEWSWKLTRDNVKNSNITNNISDISDDSNRNRKDIGRDVDCDDNTIMSRFGDNDRLTLLLQQQQQQQQQQPSSTLQSSFLLSLHDTLMKSQINRLRSVIHSQTNVNNIINQSENSINEICESLIKQYGCASNVIRFSTDPFIHGDLSQFYRCVTRSPFLARALRDAFPNGLIQAIRSPFLRYASLGSQSITNNKENSILKLTPDEKIAAFQAVFQSAKNWKCNNNGTSDDDNVDERDIERMQAVLDLFHHASKVCMSSRISTASQDCVNIVARIVNDANISLSPASTSTSGRKVLYRLARESVHQTCKRCVGISKEQAKSLKLFAQGYL